MVALGVGLDGKKEIGSTLDSIFLQRSLKAGKEQDVRMAETHEDGLRPTQGHGLPAAFQRRTS